MDAHVLAARQTEREDLRRLAGVSLTESLESPQLGKDLRGSLQRAEGERMQEIRPGHV